MIMMTDRETAERFVRGQYNYMLKEWFVTELTPEQRAIWSDDKAEHIAYCLKSIIAELFEIYPCGGFGTAVIKNDLDETVGIADNINVLYLNLYVIFLHNYVPAQTVWNARKRLQGGK